MPKVITAENVVPTAKGVANAPVVEPRTQAERIFAKFGGVPGLYKALKDLGPDHERAISALYRWNMSKKRGGTGGVVPSSAMPSVMAAARNEGVVMTAEDTDPRKL
jgi:hypothetical protein